MHTTPEVAVPACPNDVCMRPCLTLPDKCSHTQGSHTCLVRDASQNTCLAPSETSQKGHTRLASDSLSDSPVTTVSTHTLYVPNIQASRQAHKRSHDGNTSAGPGHTDTRADTRHSTIQHRAKHTRQEAVRTKTQCRTRVAGPLT